MYVIDLNGKEYPAQITYTWEGELNGSQSVSADILPTKVNLRFLHDLTEMWTLVVDGIEYKILYLKKRGKGNTLEASIKGIPLFFDKMNMQRVHKRVDRHMTADAFFNFVFHEPDELGNSSGYNFILNGTFEAIQWEGLAEGDTRLNMLKNGLNRYKAEFRITGNIIYIENMIGVDSQFRYEHRLNASNIVQEIDANEMYTYAKGYGDYGDGEGGEDWQDAKVIREYTSPLANIPGIGLREAPPIKNGNYKSSFMDEQLRILVNESLQISLTADIYDLREQGYPIAQSNLGDRVFLIDHRIGFNEEIRVVSRMIKKRWDGKVIDASITFGVPGLAKRHQANLQTATKNISDLLEGKIKLPFSVLDNAVANATRALHLMQSELSVPDNGGLMAVDKSNPNNLVLFNAAGIGISNDGGATFPEAITGNGINASVVTTGSMLADRIAGGILTSLNGNTVFNLNDGVLTMENADFELGSGALIKFTDTFNKVSYSYNRNTSGLGVGTTTSGDHVQAYVGTSRGGELSGFEDNGFSGFFANTLDRFNDDGIGNSIVARRLQLRSPYFDSNGNLTDLFGFVFNMNRSEKNFYAIDDNEYDLGRSTNRFSNVYARSYHGSMAQTSTHVAKTAIEDIDPKNAYDHFDMMDIKSWLYQQDDYTNKFNRRVGPIMEQLDPVLENLYKASPDELDFNSNFFLLVQAVKFKWEEFNERLELLENGTETA